MGRKLLPEEIVELAYNADGIIAGTETYSEDVINKLPNLKVISRLGVGLDNIDLKTADEKGIKVFITNSPAPAVAELILGLMLDIKRRISNQNQNLKEGKWEKKMGSLLQGNTLGIIGLGTVGKALIRLVQGFDFIVLAYDQVKDEKFKNPETYHYNKDFDHNHNIQQKRLTFKNYRICMCGVSYMVYPQSVVFRNHFLVIFDLYSF